MDIQRLRSLTTGKLHTEISHVYEDLETITGVPGLMTHMIPRAMAAVEPWLRERVTDERFWDGKYDPFHVGDVDITPMTEHEREQMLDRFAAMPNPLAAKDTIVVNVDGESAS